MEKQQSRVVFFVSDGTGITANTFGQSLLTQFDTLHFEQILLSRIDTEEKVQAVVRQINETAQHYGQRPIVFATLTENRMRHLLSTRNSLFLDLFGKFIEPLELELQTKSSHAKGKAHGVGTPYNQRIEAMNFALEHDDGVNIKHYEKADIILVGASRSGKTPTCVYLAMHFGMAAANYPLTEDDLETLDLPAILKPFKSKLFGLTIQAERLQEIRQKRRPDSRYASTQQCQFEVQRIEAIYRQAHLPYVNTTAMSVEEIATFILQTLKPKNIRSF
jgi:[pyruvate, water dikinase]-phosphate phosphotransferase / [pyruvate, water dikinase] kinase